MTTVLFSDHLNSFLPFTFGEQSNEGQEATPQSDMAALSGEAPKEKPWRFGASL